ncbi:DUF402 domain-containing protein, partial [Micromonospora purpureochromogenes]|uniref:DUF402 domain-containing protein n=1 Tax=Micromonospora purpureochromogenes TaxID=47872 RepID=UPI00333241C6
MVSRASQKVPSELPAGRSNWTFQELMLAELSLVTVNFASYPLPHGAFTGWYVNLETPYRRQPDGVDTSDLVLDIV